MKYKKLKKMKDNKFKRTVGISRELFELLAAILLTALNKKHSNGGRKPNLSVEDILIMYLTYYRDYPTFHSLGFQFGIDESNAYRWVKWCEDNLSVVFNDMIKEVTDMSNIDVSHEHLVDVTECSIQRPKIDEIQREYYSGKKKRHTIKIQIIMDEKTRQIVGVAFDKGSVHDFSLFKKTTEKLNKLMAFVADSGYQGIEKIFKNAITPKKRSKNNPLTDEDKELNKLISNIRIPVEHINCQVKIFRILSEKYRSRRETFCLRALIICCFYNLCM